MLNGKKLVFVFIGLSSYFLSLAQSFEYNFSNIDPNTFTFEEINCLPVNGSNNDIYNVTQSQNVKFTISQNTQANNNVLDGSLQMDFENPSEEWVINKFVFGNCQPTILDLSNTPTLNLTVRPSKDVNIKVATVIIDDNSFFVNDTLGSVLAITLKKDTWQTIKFDIPGFFGTQKVDLTKVMGVAFQVTSSSNQRIANNNPVELLIDQIKISNDQILSIDAVEAAQITTFPNPTNGKINVENLPQNATITIFNALGESVKDSNESSLDISDLVTGMYFLQVIQDGQVTYSEKIFKN